ncbi:MAG: GTPase Era [Clostridia bacterium]|nr:GTPase Era [Clostridia bacterium]MBQ5957018.1 GTPase Era [Clostridia bacterium]
MMEDKAFLSGYVSIIGSPNVGKSTLLNSLIGQKISIVSRKAQTTRNTIIGILTRRHYQIIFLDTPGIHTPKNKLQQYMVDSAYEANRDVDLTLFMLDARIGLGERDEDIMKRLDMERTLFIINKTDLINEDELRDIKDALIEKGVRSKNIIPISALMGAGVAGLEDRIVTYLSEGPMYYPDDMITDKTERFIAGEIIREKALLNLNQEIPHGIGVEIERMEEGEGLVEIDALIICEKDSHKGIIIGKKGTMLKKIASESRYDLERLFGTKVFLSVFVKVKKDWRNSPSMLKELGYRKES